MVFSSLIFCFVFLPLVIFLYYICDERYKNVLLLIASILFYTYGEPKYVIVLIASVCLNYISAILIGYFNNEKIGKIILILSVFINIGILFVFKYLMFGISVLQKLGMDISLDFKIALPIGISFFTFQAMSYVIDVYKKRVEVQKNFANLALYISFFPQLVAGPIVRYASIAEQINCRQNTVDGLVHGMKRFMRGFIKKVFIANNISVLASKIFLMDVTIVNPVVLWIGAIGYTLQIYYDFSGYSDMAIGLGEIFGFKFDENFNHPYIAKNITDFWRRWHISLSQWFRDYVYLPLGGNRVSVPRHIFNMFVVWSLTGVWHGANFTFIFWGYMYFIVLIIEKYVIKPERFRSILVKLGYRMFTLMYVVIAWVMFNSTSLRSGLKYCWALFDGYNVGWNFCNPEIIRYIREYGVFYILGIIFSMPIANRLKDLLNEKLGVKACSCISIIIVTGFFVLSISYIILGTHNPFIYFNF